ncbi:MAG: ribosome-inactivating family protein [Alphaproteobacteria bacterium]|jgi:hypothetical protein|nr:ribosome-inactivating family protein [Alphaproteobacteria bacterium]
MSMKQTKFLVIFVGVFLWSVNLFAFNCRVVNTPITLDARFTVSIENLRSVISTPVQGISGLRQTLDTESNIACTQVSIISDGGEILKVILSNRHLYVQGFITSDNIYYRFSNSSVSVITGVTTKVLGFSNNYNNLSVSSIRLSHANISSAIDSLAKFNGSARTRTRQDLVRIMFITSESLRFRSVNDISARVLTHSPQSIRWNDYTASITNWRRLSNLALNSGIVVPFNAAAALGTKDDIQIALRRPI